MQSFAPAERILAPVTRGVASTFPPMQIPGRFRDRLLDRLIGPTPIAPMTIDRAVVREAAPAADRSPGGAVAAAPRGAGPTPAMVLGIRGERIAERFLQEKGWRTIHRRFRSGHRDVDLVMERRGVVAFVEVKTRSGLTFGSPVEAVDWMKQRHLARAAQAWIAVHGRSDEDYRFDVVGVWLTGERIRVRHVANAFRMPTRW